MTLDQETWSQIPSAPGWLASDAGRVCKPRHLVKMPRGGFKVAVVEPTFGHLDQRKRRHKLCVNGKTRWVAPLICEAFQGPRPSPLHECMHLDENSLNNRAGNLAWGTKSQNQLAPKLNEARRERVRKYHQDRRASV